MVMLAEKRRGLRREGRLEVVWMWCWGGMWN